MNNRVSSKTSMSSVNETVTNATAIIPASIHDEVKLSFMTYSRINKSI